MMTFNSRLFPRMKKVFLLTVTFFIFSPILSYSQSFGINKFYPIDEGHSFISFSITYMGFAEVRGSFRDFNGTFFYDPEDINHTSVSLLINLESLDTGLSQRDKDLKSDNWFDILSFPNATFISKKVEANESDGSFDLIGDLTIKEVTKETRLVMSPPSGILKDIRGDHQVIIKGSFELNRNDYNVVGKNWSRVKEGITAVDEMVRIEFSMLGKQIQKENQMNFVRDISRPQGAFYALYKQEGFVAMREKWLEEEKMFPFVLNTIAQVELTLGNTKEAIQILELNREKFSERASIYKLLGEVYAVLGDLQSAKSNYKTALDLDSKDMNSFEVLRHLEKD